MKDLGDLRSIPRLDLLPGLGCSRGLENSAWLNKCMLRACGWHACCSAKMDCCGSPVCENPFEQARQDCADSPGLKGQGSHGAQANAPLQQLKKALALCVSKLKLESYRVSTIVPSWHF